MGALLSSTPVSYPHGCPEHPPSELEPNVLGVCVGGTTALEQPQKKKKETQSQSSSEDDSHESAFSVSGGREKKERWTEHR